MINQVGNQYITSLDTGLKAAVRHVYKPVCDRFISGLETGWETVVDRVNELVYNRFETMS